MACHGGEVVMEARRARLVIDQTSRIDPNVTRWIGRPLDFDDDAGVARSICKEVGEGVQMVVRRSSHRHQEPNGIDGRQPAHSPSHVAIERRTEVSVQGDSKAEVIELLGALSRQFPQRNPQRLAGFVVLRELIVVGCVPPKRLSCSIGDARTTRESSF
jgi:hypothetical protein